MFNKIFKKNQAIAVVTPEPPHEIAPGPAWESRLQAAIGNDTEVLSLAIDATSVDHKLSAVQALVGEDGLRTAEREFRKRDRRVHSLAKQRYETLVKQRETRASATELIQAAAALVEAPTIPANRLVELNQAWELLDPTFIEDENKSRFAKLQIELAELMRERGERKRAISSWSAAAKQSLATLSSACTGVAAASTELQELAAMLATASEQARTTLAAMPSTSSPPMSEDVAIAELGAAIQLACQDLELIEARLAVLGELQACQAPQHVTLNDEKSNPPPAAITTAVIERWQGLLSIADQRIENALNARFDECLHQQDEARKQLHKQSSLIANEKDKAALQARIQALMAAADATEAALAAGQLAEAGKQLAILQTASGKGSTNSTLQNRIGALQSEFSRLKGWQHWGGGRVRDDLVLEAETLAASTVVPEGSRPVKLPIKQLENNIEQLRARWKELDRLGGATSKPLWLRFDEALKTAYLPVAAHLAQLNETRQENLAARNNLLTVLDTLDITTDDQKTPNWKEIGRALTHFQTEWRKLGPIEHTVPHKSQPALLERMKTSVARLETPLKEVQLSAQSEREQLIVRAKALSKDVQNRDMLTKLRELQSQWQSHAKSQPLPRKTENLLWAEFKAATDALMSQREAAFNARDAEFKANQTVREALIVRLEELHQDTPPADIKRVLASVETEWRNAGEAPKNQSTKFESRYRAAREQANEYLEGSARRSWLLTCDSLLAKLALCEELESAAPSADIEARWQILPALPTRWERALQVRYKSVGENPGSNDPANSGEQLDQLLLQLESSLEIPSPAAFQMARHTLKLQAMKNVMEGRRSATPVSPDIEEMTAMVFGCTHLSSGQSSRLQSIISAIRKLGSGSLPAFRAISE
jgi:exonuclease SbcC